MIAVADEDPESAQLVVPQPINVNIDNLALVADSTTGNGGQFFGGVNNQNIPVPGGSVSIRREWTWNEGVVRNIAIILDAGAIGKFEATADPLQVMMLYGATLVVNWTGGKISAVQQAGIGVNGTFNIATNAILSNGDFNVNQSSILSVFTGGVLRRNGGPAGTTDITLRVVNNGGTVTLDNLNLKRTYSQTAGITKLSGASRIEGTLYTFTLNGTVGPNPSAYLVPVAFELAGGTFEINNGTLTLEQGKGLLNDGRITGTGTIIGDVVNNSGQIDVGGAGSIGTLRIDGSLFCASGSLNFDIGGLVAGTGYDQLIVTGFLLAGGAVHVSLLNSYQVNLNDTFSLITYASYDDQFSSVSYPGDPGTSLHYTSGFVPSNPTAPKGVGVFRLRVESD